MSGTAFGLGAIAVAMGALSLLCVNFLSSIGNIARSLNEIASAAKRLGAGADLDELIEAYNRGRRGEEFDASARTPPPPPPNEKVKKGA